MELCRAYSLGYFGGVSKNQAHRYIRQLVSHSKPIQSHKLLFLSHRVRYWNIFITKNFKLILLLTLLAIMLLLLIEQAVEDLFSMNFLY